MLEVLILAASLAGLDVLPQGAQDYSMAYVLRAVQEAPIEGMPRDGRVFRFIWVPPFPSSRMFVVRVQDVGQGPEVVAKAVRWTFDPTEHMKGQIELSMERRLSAEKWEELADLRLKGFWSFRPAEFPQPVDDGSVWVLEGSAWGERLRIVQHVPGPSPFKALCRTMLRLFDVRFTDAEASLSREQ